MDLNAAPPSNEAPAICETCGGRCCLTRPGIEAPDRFTDTSDPISSLFQALSSGRWVLETHHGIPYDPTIAPNSPDPEAVIHYPRPATLVEYKAGALFALHVTGECIFLRPSGCLLSYAERPYLCQVLVPDVAFECDSPWTRRDAALAWLAYQWLIHETLTLLGHVRQRTINCQADEGEMSRSENLD